LPATYRYKGWSLEIKEMIDTYDTRIKIRTASVMILVALLLLVLLTQVLGDNQRPRPSRSRSGPIPEEQKQYIAGQLASGYVLGMFNDSLNQAKHCFAELPEPTESLEALKKNLDKIEQEIIQTNKEQQGPKSSI
jgi:hypothetical protein